MVEIKLLLHQRIVDEGFDAVNELLSIDRLGIAVYNETTHQLEYASNSIENELSSALPCWKRKGLQKTRL